MSASCPKTQNAGPYERDEEKCSAVFRPHPAPNFSADHVYGFGSFQSKPIVILYPALKRTQKLWGRDYQAALTSADNRSISSFIRSFCRFN